MTNEEKIKIKKIKKKLFKLFSNVGDCKIKSKKGEFDPITFIQSSSSGNILNMLIGVNTTTKKIILFEIILNSTVGVEIREHKKELREEFLEIMHFVYKFSEDIKEI